MKMLRLLICTAADSLIAVASASAQDGRGGPVPQWAGVYIGIDGGPNFLPNRTYGFVGLHAGYDVEFGQFVGGAELAGEYRPQTANNTVFWTGTSSGTTYQTNNSVSADFLGTATVHLGYEVMGRWLPFVAGGMAFGPIDLKTTLAGLTGPNAGASGTNSSSTMRTGWTSGGGLRTSLTDHWSLEVRYLYYSFPATTLTTTASLGGVPKASFTLGDTGRGSLVSFGANYRFW